MDVERVDVAVGAEAVEVGSVMDAVGDTCVVALRVYWGVSLL